MNCKKCKKEIEYYPSDGWFCYECDEETTTEDQAIVTIEALKQQNKELLEFVELSIVSIREIEQDIRGVMRMDSSFYSWQRKAELLANKYGEK